MTCGKFEDGQASPIALSVEYRTLDQEIAVRSTAQPIFFPRINDCHCDRIHSSLTAVHCSDNGLVGKQPMVGKEYCAEYWLQECGKNG